MAPARFDARPVRCPRRSRRDDRDERAGVEQALQLRRADRTRADEQHAASGEAAGRPGRRDAAASRSRRCDVSSDVARPATGDDRAGAIDQPAIDQPVEHARDARLHGLAIAAHDHLRMRGGSYGSDTPVKWGRLPRERLLVEALHVAVDERLQLRVRRRPRRTSRRRVRRRAALRSRRFA